MVKSESEKARDWLWLLCSAAADGVEGLDPACAIGLEAGAELGKRARVERIADFLHQVQVIVQVVDGGQHGAQHFAAAVQVVQIGAAEAVATTIVPGSRRSCRHRHGRCR